jgi:glycogen debranching enzyme
MSLETVSILDGTTFLVTDRRGDVESSTSEPLGFFSYDTRFLSKWVLTLDDVRPTVLSIDTLQYYENQHFLVPSTGTVYINSEISVTRRQRVSPDFVEQLTVLNHSDQPREMRIHIALDADFADLFEVKDVLQKKGELYRRELEGGIVLGYRRGNFVRETSIQSEVTPQIEDGGLSFRIRIPAHGKWTNTLIVEGSSHAGVDVSPKVKAAESEKRRKERQRDVARWTLGAPQMRCSWRSLELTYEKSLSDLAALRSFPRLGMGAALPAAGLPWFMSLFGRDSMITSYQALPFTPELARTTLIMLASFQGMKDDPFRDEEPGKILHELRWGELTAFEERPHSPYYGAADSTPLFLILLDEYERWAGDRETVKQLEFAARSALEWIERYGDRDGDGYIEYERRLDTGLENQCWKDSWDSIKHADGRLAKLPRACCEIQGYVYDAKVRCARLARTVWDDPDLAARLEHEAGRLKARFNHDYWIEDGRFFALALDGEKQKVDALTSNIGHLLWSGIVDRDKADAVVGHLMGPRLFSGWGIRTMAEGDAAYNPIGYHVGTIWPHDNSIIAVGLRRYGYRQEAARVALAMLEAAHFFEGRLPEAFAGYPRADTGCPVEYPTVCSPQAWATGTPLLLIRSLLGLEPIDGRLLVDAALPESIATLELIGIPGRWERTDAFGHGRVKGVEWVPPPPPPEEPKAEPETAAEEAVHQVWGFPGQPHKPT